jgi:hypothetical protein
VLGPVAKFLNEGAQARDYQGRNHDYITICGLITPNHHRLPPCHCLTSNGWMQIYEHRAYGKILTSPEDDYAEGQERNTEQTVNWQIAACPLKAVRRHHGRGDIAWQIYTERLRS